jgi:hypothetical protein
MKNSNLCKKVGKFQRANLSNYALNITVQENDMWKSRSTSFLIAKSKTPYYKTILVM